MLVVDASVLVVALADDGADGVAARARLRDEHLSAPELVDLEVASVLRRQVMAGRIGARRAALALTDLESLPLHRASHRVLVSRCWELRETVSVYDAAYVALAETLGAMLLTADARLGRASGPRCPIEVLTPRF
ncbi:MAG: type II toxin-antitoxin system VapC family toxin [Actinomycetota bacterium]|nr:type II toxin-antitoxin system VapC family toxin [Actinomycetota bacterium]